MPKRVSALAKAFWKDHPHLTRGLSRLGEAPRSNELGDAIRLAREMDQERASVQRVDQ